MAKKHWAAPEVPVFILSKEALEPSDDDAEDPASVEADESFETGGGVVESLLTFELHPVTPRSPKSWVAPRRSHFRH